MTDKLKPNFFIFVDVHEKFYKVTSIEPFQYETGREATAIFSGIDAGAESTYKNLTILEPDDVPKRLFQVFAGVKYGMRYYFKIPTGTNRFGIDEDKSIGFIDNYMSPFDDPNEDFEMWFVKEFYPSINAVNDTTITLTPQIRFTGFKYDIEEVKSQEVITRLKHGQLPFKKIIIGGVKTS